MSKIDELRWIRVYTPDLIPKYLIEQIKKKDYTVEDFYAFHRATCVHMTENGPKLNALSHLYVMGNKENLVKGFVWFTIDALSKCIVIQTYTVDKEYWKDGGAVQKLSDHIKEIRKKAKLNKIYWITDYPKHSQKHGFKISKSVLMEYSEEENGSDFDGRSKCGGSSESSNSRTTIIPDEHIGTDSGTSGPSIQPIPAAI